MNKKLIAAAIAAAVAAPAAMAETTLYGKVHMDIRSNDSDHVDNWTVNSNASRLGVKGSEDLGNGLKAIFQYEMTYSGTDSVEAFGAARNSYIGLGGNWGQVRVGRHDTPMKVAFYAAGNELLGDSIIDINKTIGFQEVRTNNAIAYISPSFSGFTLAAAIVPGEQSGNADPHYVSTSEDYVSCNPGLDAGEDEVSTRATCNVYTYADSHSHSVIQAGDNLATDIDTHSHMVGTVTQHVEAGQRNNEDGLMDSWSVGLMYAGNGLKASAGYEELADTSNLTTQSDEELETWQMGASYAFGAFQIGAQYQDSSLGDTDWDIWGLMGKWTFGNNALMANYGEYDSDADYLDKDSFGLALQHKFSKRTSVYVAYSDQSFDDSDDDLDRFALGMIHNF